MFFITQQTAIGYRSEADLLSRQAIQLELVGLVIFVRDRSQSVRVNYIISKSSKVFSGVAQRNVLGPILFLIFINDVCSVSDNHKLSVKLFAHDIKLYSSTDISTDYLSLQNHLNLIYQRSLDWYLGLHPAKCVNLSLNTSTCNRCYSIGNTLQNNVSSSTDLGVIVNKHVNFESHVDKMFVKENQMDALILRRSRSRDLVLLTKAFVTYVKYILQFASRLWSPYKHNYIDKIRSNPSENDLPND